MGGSKVFRESQDFLIGEGPAYFYHHIQKNVLNFVGHVMELHQLCETHVKAARLKESNKILVRYEVISYVYIRACCIIQSEGLVEVMQPPRAFWQYGYTMITG